MLKSSIFSQTLISSCSVFLNWTLSPRHFLTLALLSTVNEVPHIMFLLCMVSLLPNLQGNWSLRFCVPPCFSASLRFLTEFRAGAVGEMGGVGIPLLPACHVLYCLQIACPLKANWLTCPALPSQIFHLPIFKFYQHSQDLNT